MVLTSMVSILGETKPNITSMVNKTIEITKNSQTAIGYYSNDEYFVDYYSQDHSLNDSSLFQIGSLSKSFTAFGIMRLVDEGKISLDDLVYTYIPELTSRYSGSTLPKETLKIKHLLYQTSGFNNSSTHSPIADEDDTLLEHVLKSNNKELVSFPGETFNYGNINYNILGLIIERVSNKKYSEYMTTSVFTPLGLSNTFADGIGKKDNLVIGQKVIFFGTTNFDYQIRIGDIPSGFILSSAKDIIRWNQIHSKKILINDEVSRVVESMHIPNEQSIIDDHTKYASGLFVDSITGDTYHPGGTINFSSYFVFNEADGIGVSVLLNINLSSNTQDIGVNAMNLLRGNDTLIYSSDVWTTFDLVFSFVILFSSLGILIAFIFIGLSFKKIFTNASFNKLNSKSVVLLILSCLPIIVSIAIYIALPLMFGYNWTTLTLWAPSTLDIGLLTLVILGITLIGLNLLKALFLPKNSIPNETELES